MELVPVKTSPQMVGLAAEFAVASELARRNIYAQPTFGALKRTDLLAFGGSERPIRIEAKGKQGHTWPCCKGIGDRNSILVFVDFTGKAETDRADFYVLTASDWRSLVKRRIRRLPEKGIEIDADGCPVWTTQVKNGKPYRGMGVSVSDVATFKESWQKLEKALGRKNQGAGK